MPPDDYENYQQVADRIADLECQLHSLEIEQRNIEEKIDSKRATITRLYIKLNTL